MNDARPIRIAFPVLGDSMGGAYFSMLELTENLPEGYERVIILHERGVFADYLDERGIPYEVLDHIKNFRRDGRRRWGLKFSTLRSLILPLARYLKEGGFDIVHTQTQAMHKTWAAAGKLAGVPHVWHQRTGGRPRGIERRLTSQVICVSEFVRRDMGDAFPKDRMVVIANPFDVARFQSIDRRKERAALTAELSLPETTTLIGFIANIHPRKRPKLFVEAAAMVIAKSEKPLAFLLFGSDRSNYVEEVKVYAEGLGVDLHLMGFRTPPEVNVAGLNIYVGCSVDEGFGRAPIEAGLVGTPIILSDSGNHPELTEHGVTGQLFTADNVVSLSEALLECLINQEEAQIRAERAYAIFQNKYDRYDHVEQLGGLYQNFVGSN